MPEGTEQKAFDVSISFIPYVNLALQQNGLSIVRELKIKNNGARDLENLECILVSTPEIIKPCTAHIARIAAGEEIGLQELSIDLNHDRLAALTEMETGKLILALKAGAEILVHAEYPLTALSPDEWLGPNLMPELLAAFVTPNMEAVQALASLLPDELKKATGSSAVQGYQADKKRVYAICAAIYNVIHSWGIAYANPPANYGTPGQKIRFADSIYKYKLGTCLDLSLLFASVMENCGLHPFIVLQKGHAYVGCHLEDHYFADLPVTDLQTIRKGVELDELLVIEATAVTGDTPFSDAEAMARSMHLNIDDDFQYAIDIIRARYSGVHPLPLASTAGGFQFQTVTRKANDITENSTRDLQQTIDLSKLETGSKAQSRMDRWRQKLLDLSLRNHLLNVRDTRQVILLACADITKLEDKMAADETLTIKPLSDLLGEKEMHDISMLRSLKRSDELGTLLMQELEHKRLWTLLSPRDTQQHLTYIYRQSKTDLEEGGVNTLFLGIGFLEWKVSENDEKSYLAPILLMPVRLTRHSMAEGIRLSRVDDETIINVTLLELLHREHNLTIPGLDPLPTDDSGIDVGKVLQIFRQSVQGMKGWEVREEVRLGLFSFSKFIMWSDLAKRSELLQKQPLVKHLVQGGGVFDDGIKVFPPEDIGKELNPEHLFCPVSADSSQLTAVKYAELGKSFVLHGPPGTGKSQTITNIIAHNLALGKRVLFVSEKKAALDVVQKRLAAIGLKPFCLELHSNKAGKSEVLKQFAESLAVTDAAEPAEWKASLDALLQEKKALDDYAVALHHEYPNGLSAYRCCSSLMNAGSTDFASLSGIDTLHGSRESLNSLQTKVEELAAAFAGTRDEDREALRDLSPVDWNPQVEKTIADSARGLSDACEAAATTFKAQADLFGIGTSQVTVSRLDGTAVFSKCIGNSGDIPPALLTESAAAELDFLQGFVKIAAELQEAGKNLFEYRLELLKELGCDGIEQRIAANTKKFFISRFFANRALIKELAQIKKLGTAKLSIAELSRSLPFIRSYQAAGAKFAAQESRAKEILGDAYTGSPDWQALANGIANAKALHAALLGAFPAEPELRAAALQKVRGRRNADSTFFTACKTPIKEQINEFINAENSFKTARSTFASLAPKLAGESGVTDITSLSQQTRGIAAHAGAMRNVLLYLKKRKAAQEAGLSALIDELESKKTAAKDLPERFRVCYNHEMLDAILSTDGTLSGFIGTAQNERVRKFCALDDAYTAYSRKIVFAKLAAQLPRRRGSECPDGTELGILQRECAKQRRQIPVRELLMRIPNLQKTLKPCFLMSPLSVAQYLPPEAAFDMVVFDEASQIPVWDAIGAIARGKQLIVVGDPKQMPPTQFFQKGDTGTEDAAPDAPAEDMESILDECLAAGVLSAHLNWHYRSRHESLIAFSNHNYYEDKLFTFPAACDGEHLGVHFHYVQNGNYDHKATRTNRKEAAALVEYIFGRLADPALRGRSMGVVTFSEAQRMLIEDLIESGRAKHPEFEPFFSEQGEEPFFVKNLENVQGDERDVILFSVCYAPDSTGKFSMNFGPLNRAGGERRLNVAITRAKEEVVVFSSIHSEMIDLSRTNATGAKHLKYFIDYAEKGLKIQTQGNSQIRGQNGLSGTIAKFLGEHGWNVRKDVGCSNYRMNLAVLRKGSDTEYLLGIECDDESYRKQKTSRDREHLRNAVLRSLGWHLYRAWSVDWMLNRGNAEADLLKALELAEKEPVKKAAVIPVPAATPPAAKPQSEPPQAQKEQAPETDNRPRYKTWHGTVTLPQESFYDPAKHEFITKQIRAIIAEEAPIYDRLLRARVVKAWGFTRTGGQIQAVLDACIPADIKTTRIADNIVYWNSDPADFHGYRVPENPESRRSIDEIPLEELANAMRGIQTDFQGCETEALYRETVKLFGFGSVTAKMKKSLELAENLIK